MDDLTVAIVGYISGALAGAFITLIILIYIYMYHTGNKIEDIEPVYVITEFLNVYYQESSTIFSITFILGFMSGVGVFASKSSN